MSLTCKVILIGEAMSGKTSILYTLINNCFKADTFSTVGVDFTNYLLKINNKELNISIWDTSAQERYRSIAEHYLIKFNSMELF